MTDVRGRRQDSHDSLVEEIVPSSAWTEDSSSHYLLVDIPGFKKELLNLQVHDHGHILVGGERQTENKIFRFEQTFKIPENSDTEKINGRYEGGILYVIVPKLVKDEERKPLNAATDDNIRGKKHEHKHDQEEHGKRHEHHQEEQDEKHKHEHKKEHQGRGHRGHQEEQEHEHEHKEEHHGGGHMGHHGQSEDKKKVVGEGGFQEAPTATWTLEGGILGIVMEILSKNKGIAVTAVLAFALGVLLSQKFQSNAGSEGGLPPM